jgi:polar amino acid transport system permease protein
MWFPFMHSPADTYRITMFSDAFIDQLLAPKYILWMLNGLGTTIVLTMIAAFFATLLGFILATAHASPHRTLSLPATVYIAVFRNTPLLVQLLFWYFGVPGSFPEGWMEWLNSGHSMTVFGLLTLYWPSYEFLSACIGLTLYSSAFISEEIRSGIRGVSSGQTSAGAALGLTRQQIARFIILPQALRIAFLPLLGQYMNLLKNTSLAMAIGLAELSYTARQVEAETFRTFQAFGVATLLYIGVIALIEAFGYWRTKRHVTL